MTTDAMKDSIAHIVRVAARDGAATGPERLLAYLPSTSVDDAIADLDRAITAHVEAEVARRLAAAPDVEAAIVDYAHAAQSDFDTHEEREALRAAIAADKARAVEAESIAAIDEFRRILTAPRAAGVPCPVCKVARPTPDKARQLVEWYGRECELRESERDPDARAALLRALGVEA